MPLDKWGALQTHLLGDHAVQSYNSLDFTFEFRLSRYPETTFGQKIKRLRLKRGFKQADLAQVLGVSEDTVRNWEKDRHLPTPCHLSKLEGVLWDWPEAPILTSKGKTRATEVQVPRGIRRFPPLPD